MRALLALTLLLSGCATSPAPADLEQAAPDALLPSELAKTNCQTWSATVDAPPTAFPQNTPYKPTAGTTPGTILAVYEGSSCGDVVDLIEAFPMAGRPGAAVLSWWWSSGNDTAALNAWGVPVEKRAMVVLWSSRLPTFYIDGPGDENATRTVIVAGALAAGAAPGQAWNLHVVIDGADTVVVERLGTPGQTWWQGAARAGDRSLLAADDLSDWRGRGIRQAGVNLAVRPLEPTGI